MGPELEGLVCPHLEDAGVSEEDAAAFVDAVVAVFLAHGPDSDRQANHGQSAQKPLSGDSGAKGAAGDDCLCHVSNMLLMYGGSPQPLLRNATLELRRGHRYGVIGSNGSGKTTLMARLASK